MKLPSSRVTCPKDADKTDTNDQQTARPFACAAAGPFGLLQGRVT